MGTEISSSGGRDNSLCWSSESQTTGRAEISSRGSRELSYTPQTEQSLFVLRESDHWQSRCPKQGGMELSYTPRLNSLCLRRVRPLVGTEISSGGGREAIPRLNSVYTILAIPSATLALQNEST